MYNFSICEVKCLVSTWLCPLNVCLDKLILWTATDTINVAYVNRYVYRVLNCLVLLMAVDTKRQAMHVRGRTKNVRHFACVLQEH